MMNLYVIGPVTGIPNDNRPEFERVRKELEKSGCKVTIPHDVVKHGVPWGEAMHRSIRTMLRIKRHHGYRTRYYERIAMLDGWENSKGAVIEHDLAEALGIPCKPWKEWL